MSSETTLIRDAGIKLNGLWQFDLGQNVTVLTGDVDIDLANCEMQWAYGTLESPNYTDNRQFTAIDGVPLTTGGICEIPDAALEQSGEVKGYIVYIDGETVLETLGMVYFTPETRARPANYVSPQNTVTMYKVVENYADLADLQGTVAIVRNGLTGYRKIEPTVDGTPKYTNLYLNPLPFAPEALQDLSFNAYTGAGTIGYAHFESIDGVSVFILSLGIGLVTTAYAFSEKTVTSGGYTYYQGWSKTVGGNPYVPIDAPPEIPEDLMDGGYVLNVESGDAGYVISDTPYTPTPNIYYKENGTWKPTTKKTTAISDTSTHDEFPSAKAVYNLVDEIDLTGYEQTANKTTELSDESTDTEYPTAKSVYDYIDNLPLPVGTVVEVVDNYADLADANGTLAIVINGLTGYRYLIPTDGNELLKYTNLYFNPIPTITDGQLNENVCNVLIIDDNGINIDISGYDYGSLGKVVDINITNSLIDGEYVWCQKEFTSSGLVYPLGWSYYDGSSVTPIDAPPEIPTGEYRVIFNNGDSGWIVSDSPYASKPDIWYLKDGLWNPSTKPNCIVQNIEDLPNAYDADPCVVINGKTNEKRMYSSTYEHLYINPIPRIDKNISVFAEITDSANNIYVFFVEPSKNQFSNATKDVEICAFFSDSFAQILGYFWSADDFVGIHYEMGEQSMPRGWSKVTLSGDDIVVTPISASELPTIENAIIPENYSTTAGLFVRNEPYSPMPAIYYKVKGIWRCDDAMRIDNSRAKKMLIRSQVETISCGLFNTLETTASVQLILPKPYEQDLFDSTTELSTFVLSIKVSNASHAITFNKDVLWVGSTAHTFGVGLHRVDGYFDPQAQKWCLSAVSLGVA